MKADVGLFVAILVALTLVCLWQGQPEPTPLPSQPRHCNVFECIEFA